MKVQLKSVSFYAAILLIPFTLFSSAQATNINLDSKNINTFEEQQLNSARNPAVSLGTTTANLNDNKLINVAWVGARPVGFGLGLGLGPRYFGPAVYDSSLYDDDDYYYNWNYSPYSYGNIYYGNPLINSPLAYPYYNNYYARPYYPGWRTYYRSTVVVPSYQYDDNYVVIQNDNNIDKKSPRLQKEYKQPIDDVKRGMFL